MQRMQTIGRVVALVAVALIILGGCASKSPLEQLEENRSRYSAEVNGFFVQETPVVAEVDPMAEGDGEATEAEEEAGDGTDEMDAEPPAVEVVQNVHLDLIVKHDSFEQLAGVTVDIVQVDSNENEKGHWRLWVDTANVPRANPTQYSHVIEDVDYVDGDGFFVEVRQPIAEADRGDYREFDGLDG